MSQKIGFAGEQACGAYFTDMGYRVLRYNYRSRHGEIDLIVENETELVFVEVKTRKPGSLVSGLESVTLKKQQNLRRTAELYLQTTATEKQARFDVVEMIHERGCFQIQHHLKNAF